MIHQLQFLMNDPDSRRLGLARAGKVNGSTVVENGPAVFRVDAGEDFHQRRFAGPVLAHQGMNLARLQFKAHAVQRPHAGEGLADILDRDQRRHSDGSVCSGGTFPPFRAKPRAAIRAVSSCSTIANMSPRTASFVNSESPQADRINPRASAVLRRGWPSISATVMTN